MPEKWKPVFVSTHYVAVAEFQVRAARYTPFVGAVATHIAAANSDCAFRAGKRPLTYWAGHAFLLAMAALLVFVLFALGGSGVSDLVWVKLGIVVALVPLALAYARKNRPRRFASAAIPPEVLPGG